ncbi:MAG: hypothetical protein V4702_04910 [Patescibacteria group bacterium]
MDNEHTPADSEPILYTSFYESSAIGDADVAESESPSLYPEPPDPEERDIRDKLEELRDIENELREIQNRIDAGDETAADMYRKDQLTAGQIHYKAQTAPENTDPPAR